jgi:hypothetical protein
MADVLASVLNGSLKRMKDMGDGTVAEVVSSVSTNITTKFREAFEALSAEHWTTVIGSGDIVQVDGNTAGASYLDISKSPYVAGNETTLETVTTFGMPVEIAFGAHRSQATLGQEFSFEFVDTGTPLPDIADLAITSITQTTTVLTIDFAAPHGLVPGKAIGVRDCSNLLANYPALVVATIPSPTQITATAGPGGTITSQTITNPAGAKGFVFFRERFGRASNGVSQIFENATATSSAFYVRSEAGDSLPSGTIAGAHGVTVGTTASVQLVNTPYAYAFAPTTEYRITVQADRVQWSDAAVDAVAQTSSRLLRTQIVPDPSETYKFRIRANNSKSLSIINGKVVSVTKTTTTTGTFNAPAHGLVTGDLITYYGNSNAAAAFFPNLTVATAVTVVDANNFTAVIGSGTTGTGYGGIYSKVQGGNILPGVNNNTASNATLSTLTGGTRQLVLTGGSSWSGLVIGDYVEVAGVSNVTDGALLGVDGAWRVANSVTTALTLVPATAAFAATLPADFALTNSGGAIVKRTCLRVSFVRIFDYERERVEMLARPTGDISGAAPVAVQNVPAVTVSSGTITTVTTAGTPLAPANAFFLNSAATTNGALILTGTSGLQAFWATNTGAAVAFVKLYNKATAPTVGTDVPEMIIPVPAAVGGVPGVAEVTPGFNGHRFPLGLGIAITGLVADTDTTAVAAGQVKVKLSRTV